MGENGKGTGKTFRIERRDDGVAIIWMDIPNESVNTLRADFASEFASVFDEIESDGAIRAVVFASGKKDNFLAGADISMLEKVKTPAEAAALGKQGQNAMNRVEGLKKPVVAAIHGACLGGGLEVALACHGRIASDDKKTKLGLPEVQLGVLPGAGGTQRLPRLIGVQQALDLLLTGRQIDAKKAKELGLVDEVVPRAIMIEVAAKRAAELAATPAHKKSPTERLRALLNSEELTEFALAENPLGRKVLFDQARKQLLKKTRGNYPGPERILEVVKVGLKHGMERGLEAENQAFGDLVVSPEAVQLMGIYFATTALKKDTGVDDPSVEARPVRKVGMMGAGLMGAGIAYVTSALAKTPVRMKDRDDEGVLRGMEYVRNILDGRVKRKRMSKTDAARWMSTVSGTTDYSGFDTCDVVIEAVFEDLSLKQRIVKEIEEAGPAEVIFASNTSSLPITKIAEASKHPETVIGMHYFSPVHKMPLLEIIVTDKTAPWVTATCVELGKKQGKTVIVVRDGVGFYTSRILAPFMFEASHLLAEGVPIDRIDGALMDFGYPVGPIKLMDEVGIDVGEKVGHIMHDAFGDRMSPPPGIDRLIADKRFGRKNKRGFYKYSDDSKGDREIDESIYGVLGISPTNKLSKDEIIERCALQMVNEAALCFGEGILRSARDGDIGALFGLGFPPFRGGPFRYVDATGADKVVRKLEGYRDRLGARFTPAPVLVEMAKSHGKFHGESAPRPGTSGKSAKKAAPNVRA